MPHKSSSDTDMQSVTSKKSEVTHLSNQSSSGGGSESASGNAANRQDYVPPTVGKREEANVMRARALVALILLLAVTAVATAANLLVKEQERSDFENMVSFYSLSDSALPSTCSKLDFQFDKYSTQIVTVSRSKQNQFFDALDSFASSIGAYAAAEHALRNTSWPFYRIPEWSVQAEKITRRSSMKNPNIGIAPIVRDDQIDEWNSYAAVQNPIWFQESIEHEGYTEFTAQELLSNFTIPFVHVYDPENDYQPTPVSGRSEVLPYFQEYTFGKSLGNPLMFTNIELLLASPTVEEMYNITKVTRGPTLGFTRIETEPGVTIPGNQILQPVFDTGDTKAAARNNVAVILI
eukprot:scaffold22626_cov108-Cylindrotheca_fusiformis.AAC.1